MGFKMFPIQFVYDFLVGDASFGFMDFEIEITKYMHI